MSIAPTKQFTLPSLGRFYGDKIPGGVIEVKKMTISELSLLEQGHIEVRMDEIIKRCSVLPAGFGPVDLLSSDRMFLLFAIRSYSFSTAYTYEFKCPACSAKNKKTCDLSADLTIKNPDDGIEEPISISLPDAEATVSLRFLRGKDEDEIRIAKARTATVSDHILALERQIVKINDDTPAAAAKAVFVRNLTAADVIRIKNRMEVLESGISTLVKATCDKCAEEAEMGLPIGREFFRPSNL